MLLRFAVDEVSLFPKEGGRNEYFFPKLVEYSVKRSGRRRLEDREGCYLMRGLVRWCCKGRIESYHFSSVLWYM